MRQGNLSSSRVRWRDGSPMAAFDRLPPELRRWLNDAALPWSPRSAARIYARARAEGADPATALARLTAAEQATLAREGYRRGP